MNDTALNALTNPKRSERDLYIIWCARMLRNTYPALEHSSRDRVFNMLLVDAHSGYLKPPVIKNFSLKSTTLLATDVADIWQYFIDNPNE
jgi:hypothetical protein